MLSVLVAAVLSWNIAGAVTKQLADEHLPAPMVSAMHTLGLAQRWGMFAPKPSLIDHWPTVTAEWKNGDLTELFSGDFEPPQYLEQGFPSYRWRKYFDRISRTTKQRRVLLAEYYLRSHCFQLANEINGGPEKISFSVTEYTTLSHYREKQRHIPVATISCPSSRGGGQK